MGEAGNRGLSNGWKLYSTCIRLPSFEIINDILCLIRSRRIPSDWVLLSLLSILLRIGQRLQPTKLANFDTGISS